jgi:hypothetical protein
MQNALSQNLTVFINFNADKEKEVKELADEKAKKEIPADLKRPVVYSTRVKIYAQ